MVIFQSVFRPRRSPTALCVGPRRCVCPLCRTPAVGALCVGPGALCVGAQRSLCGAPVGCFVSGPGALSLCVSVPGSVSGPGTLLPLSLCVRPHHFLADTRARDICMSRGRSAGPPSRPHATHPIQDIGGTHVRRVHAHTPQPPAPIRVPHPIRATQPAAPHPFHLRHLRATDPDPIRSRGPQAQICVATHLENYCLGDSVSGSGGLCVTARRSLCRGPALSVGIGPAALSQDLLCQVPQSCRPGGLCVEAEALFVSGPGVLCQGVYRGPPILHNALCVRPRQFLFGARRRSLCRGPALFVSGPGPV